VCIFLPYPAWKAHVPFYIVACGLSASTVFFQVFGVKVIEHTMCVLIFSTTFVGNVSQNFSEIS